MSNEALTHARLAVEHAAAELEIATSMFKLGTRSASLAEVQKTGMELTVRLGSICTGTIANIVDIARQRVHPPVKQHPQLPLEYNTGQQG